jgi:hypothetical protein
VRSKSHRSQGEQESGVLFKLRRRQEEKKGEREGQWEEERRRQEGKGGGWGGRGGGEGEKEEEGRERKRRFMSFQRILKHYSLEFFSPCLPSPGTLMRQYCWLYVHIFLRPCGIF